MVRFLALFGLLILMASTTGNAQTTPPKSVEGVTIEHSGERDVVAAEVRINLAETTPFDVVNARQRLISGHSLSQFGQLRNAGLQLVGSFSSQMMIAGNFLITVDPTYSDQQMRTWIEKHSGIRETSDIQPGEKVESAKGRGRLAQLKVGSASCVYGYALYDFSQAQNFLDNIWDTSLAILMCDPSATTASVAKILKEARLVDRGTNEALLASRRPAGAPAAAAPASQPAAARPEYCTNGPLVFTGVACSASMTAITKEEYDRRLVAARGSSTPPAARPEYCTNGPLVFTGVACSASMTAITKEEYDRRLVAARGSSTLPAPTAPPARPSTPVPAPAGARYCAADGLDILYATYGTCRPGERTVTRAEYDRLEVERERRKTGAASPTGGSVEERLSRLKELVQRGLITEQEAATRRQEILKEL
ncbi:MAG: SHOCT domain-containing protein [Alphaproteobacteria bacterium]|nr:SHOCT domain-containing protein [Alphaproteobacteria bacterium]